jgi:hypothetical protein
LGGNVTWYGTPYNEALDYNPKPEVLPPVCANIVFDLTDPEGERRLREMLDAPRVKLVLWRLDQWLREKIKYADEISEDTRNAFAWIRRRLYELCDDYSVNLDD